MLYALRRSFLLPLATSLLLGLLFYRVIPSFLVFGAFVPFFIFLDQTESWKRRALGGFFVGFIYFLFVLHTLVYVDWFGFVSSEHLFMQMMYIVMCVYTGILYAAFAFGYSFSTKRSLLILIAVPALFTLMEVAKRILSFGFTWGFIGYLSDGMPQVMHMATLAGVLGLTFLIIFVNVSITRALVAGAQKEFRAAVRILLIMSAVCVSVFVASLAVQKFSTHSLGSLRVAIMETRDQRGSLVLAESPYTQLVTDAKAQGAELILMPESLIDPKQKNISTTDMETIIGDLVGEYRGTVIVGGFRNEDGRRYNSAFFWHDGTIEATYDKHFLVPFAEYLPTFISTFGPKGRTLYMRGATDQLPRAGGIAFGGLVCQEVNYPEAGIRPVREGAEILVSGANDGFVRASTLLAWIAPTDNPWFEQIEYRYARFRAIETGRYLLRSTKIGIAGIIAPTGESVVTLDAREQGVRVADVERMEGMTPYVRFGDWPILILCVFILWITVIKKRISTYY